MLTCIVCSKQIRGGSLHELEENEDPLAGTPTTRHTMKSLTSQIKDIALKARSCKPCAGSASGRRFEESSESASGSERFLYSYRRTCASSRSFGSTPLANDRAQFMDDERREWVAQIEPGVLITFLPLAQGGNDLKRIRFSRDMFNKRQAQQWWGENYDKVTELYNVRGFNRQAVALSTPPRSEDEIDSVESSPMTPPLSRDCLPHNFHRQMSCNNVAYRGYSSSDSRHPAHCLHHSQQHCHHGGRHCCGSCGLASTPKLSSISGTKTKTSSIDARTCSSPEDVDHSGDLSASMSNESDLEQEWVEEDEPGVYITIRAMPGGIRELRRVRFSRERFGEIHARLWWEENRRRILEQYL